METVTERREPNFMAGTYESDWGKILIVNHFEAIGDSKTRWSFCSNMVFNGFMKIVGIFFSGSILKRNESDMERFKQFVETASVDRS